MSPTDLGGPRLDRPASTADDASDLAATAVAARPARPPSRGLWLSGLGIIGVALALFLYYRSLGVGGSANSTISSALDWDSKLWPQLKDHLIISFWSTVLVVAVAVPLGVLLTRPGIRRIGPAVLTVANSGQALPAYGLLILFLALMGSGLTTVIMALVVYALLPVLRNTMVGLDQVDRNIIEAGRGMGMTRAGVLTRIELPLAVPVILAGVRTAMVVNIGMATLAYLIGGGGLGITISAGLKLKQDPVLIVGAILVALVALTFDWVGAAAERYLTPRGI